MGEVEFQGSQLKMGPTLQSRYFLVKEPVPEVLELLGAARANEFNASHI